MKTRILGRTSERVSEIGFGAWGIGKTWWGSPQATDDRESLQALRKALELGITFFDTAYVYGDGHSEDLIAEILQETKASVFVATKCPPKNHEWPAHPHTPLRNAFPPEWVIACTERSLKKLRRDCLDLQQFHVWTDAWIDQDEWKETVLKLKRQGKIRYFGVSINDCEPDSALQLVESGLVDTVQVIYNLFEQAPAEQLFPLCQKRNVGVIVRVPFDEGSLTGVFTPDTRFEEGDFRADYFGGQRLRETCYRVGKLQPYLGPHASTLPLLALKFILTHPAVSVVIPGMRKVKHVEENVRASDDEPLPASILEALSQQAWRRNFYL